MASAAGAASSGARNPVARAVVPGESEAIPGVSISTTLFNAGAGQPTSTRSTSSTGRFRSKAKCPAAARWIGSLVEVPSR
ncbi:MAG: hypothetical protein KDB60_19130, partial [Propionibacteriaceae bacterium]|nr:hypothetical protein [Propionibacteriaceae bacterium]